MMLTENGSINNKHGTRGTVSWDGWFRTLSRCACCLFVVVSAASPRSPDEEGGGAGWRLAGLCGDAVSCRFEVWTFHGHVNSV